MKTIATMMRAREIDAGAAAFLSSSFVKILTLPDTSALLKMFCGSGTFVLFGVKKLDAVKLNDGVKGLVWE